MTLLAFSAGRAAGFVGRGCGRCGAEGGCEGGGDGGTMILGMAVVGLGILAT